MNFQRQPNQTAFTFVAYNKHAVDVTDSVHVVVALRLPPEAAQTRVAGFDAMLLVYLNPHPRPSFMFNRDGGWASIAETIQSRFRFSTTDSEALARLVLEAVSE